MEFGKGFGSYYSGWDAWVKEYPQEDRDAYPALFALPDDCYEIKLDKPLGIAFIEGDDGGVVVDYLVEGGNAEASGKIQPGARSAWTRGRARCDVTRPRYAQAMHYLQQLPAWAATALLSVKSSQAGNLTLIQSWVPSAATRPSSARRARTT